VLIFSKRGHQQDAEEFLNLLLETLHDESANVINSIPNGSVDIVTPASPISERSSVNDAGWQEVGPKQKASTTRATGDSANETPITKIFAGSYRSELRVQGKKPSITIQPYQPLQLDIGAPEIHNIVDALKGWTRSETVQGDFQSPRGPNVSATKQSFIETLPPVLILHLKRFEFHNSGGTQKIWKKVGYPLELTIPKEVFPQAKRAQITLSGLPKFRLDGVIYHHGQNASSGHYTVDVRRQEGQEWIRIDDTFIKRIRSEDVAEGGAEEDPKVLAKALEQASKDKKVSGNLFDQFGAVEEEEGQTESGWNTAGNSKDAGTKNGTKKWSAVANGTATPNSVGTKTPTAKKDNAKDSKVAYILFYRRI
jgi:ubiquitin carboxyl-terminal hydrolase 10